MSKISELVKKSKEADSEDKAEVNFGFVPNFKAQEITAKTGIIVKGALRTLSSYAVNHTIKRHGNDKEEKERGQISVTDKDFDLIPTIINESDDIIKGKDGSRGKQAVLFYKKINGKDYFVVTSIVKNKEGIKMDFDTMYIKK